MPITHKACLPLVRLFEPSFMVKANCQFDIPAGHLSARYKDIGDEVLERVHDDAAHKIPVKPIKYPDLTFLKQFDKRATFLSFQESHAQYSNALIKLFDDIRDLDELISTALYVRDQINRQLFVYCYLVVLSHRYDTDNIQLPQYFEVAPQYFFKKNVFCEIIKSNHHRKLSVSSENRVTRQTNSDQQPIEIPFHQTMGLANPEEKLTFFREDIGVNSHHFHWHVIYPSYGPSSKFYDKDRRGEMFYYMHHQMVNVYHLNRLTVGIGPVVPYTNFREPIKGGYFPNMNTMTSPLSYPPRPDNVQLRDLHRGSTVLTVDDMERWYQRLQDAIDSGYCWDKNGQKVDLLNESGINTFVNLWESNSLSVNSAYYGNLHNSGHVMISSCHDPDSKYLETYGVMSDTPTAVRDPIFFRWHQSMDNMCIKLKSHLTPYSTTDLSFNGIQLQSLDLLNSNDLPLDNNEIITFWQKSDVNLQHGLDYHSQQPFHVRFTHLNYQHFTYSFKVNNTNSSPVQGTIRIFLLPIYNESHNEYQFDAARTKAYEVDRFVSKFSPGVNRILRKSSDSSMALSFERTFPLQSDGKMLMSAQPNDVQTFCQCGWPQNMLFPKGTDNGYSLRLFVMISDFNRDKVDQPASNGVCNDNYPLCGLRNRKYPDARAMGFPFDRKAIQSIGTMKDFIKGHDNMITKEISIRHLSENTAQIGDDLNNIQKI